MGYLGTEIKLNGSVGAMLAIAASMGKDLSGWDQWPATDDESQDSTSYSPTEGEYEECYGLWDVSAYIDNTSNTTMNFSIHPCNLPSVIHALVMLPAGHVDASADNLCACIDAGRGQLAKFLAQAEGLIEMVRVACPGEKPDIAGVYR